MEAGGKGTGLGTPGRFYAFKVQATLFTYEFFSFYAHGPRKTERNRQDKTALAGA